MAERRSGASSKDLSRIVVVKPGPKDSGPLAHILKALGGDRQVVRGDGTVEKKKGN